MSILLALDVRVVNEKIDKCNCIMHVSRTCMVEVRKMPDKSNLEERLFKLKKKYEQPISVAETKPNYGLVGVLSALLGAGLVIAGVFLSSRFFRPSPTAYQPQPTPIVGEIVMETPTLLTTPTPVSGEGPFREHQTAAIGSGPLMNVTYSDGMAPYTDEWLAANHYRIQRFRLEENPDGCGISIYNTNKIWFGSSMPTTITVNDVPIAELYVVSGRHAHVFEYPLKIGDKICVTDLHPSGYHIIFGPDMYWHYDSYCYRGHC